MLCPVCSVQLVMSERQGIEIDYCPQCRGVWLDRGELDKIIERSVGSGAQGRSAPPPQQGYQQPYRQEPRYEKPYHHDSHHHGHYKKKHKSIWGEIFDFD